MNNDHNPRGKNTGFMPALGENEPAPHRMHPSQSNLLFNQRGRVIVDEIEAHDIMSHAYSLNAQEMTDAAISHRHMTASVSGFQGRSVIRDFADLIHRAGSMDPNTSMQSHLTDLSSNTDLKMRPYAQGGGFTAFENETRTPPTKKKPEGGVTTGQRNIEFHPPGGLHTGGVYTDDHGSYLRPATQLNQRKSLLRSFSSGALTEHNK